MAEKASIVTVRGLSKAVGEREILKDLTFWILEGARIGLIGRNGEGKSTFARILAGLEEPTAGEILYKPGLKIGIQLQEPDLGDAETVDEALLVGSRRLTHPPELAAAIPDPELIGRIRFPTRIAIS